MRSLMHNKDFDEYVRRQQEIPPGGPPPDWNRERDEWLGYLNDLYKEIESFLSKYASLGQIRSRYQDIELNEEYIGSYNAKQMILRIGKQEVKLVPIGTLLIGFKGRVDVVGSSGKAQIVLVDNRVTNPRSLVHVSVGIGGKLPIVPKELPGNIQWEWKILTRPPERRFIKVTQQTFLELIMEVAHG
jgi:hypothetical protein